MEYLVSVLFCKTLASFVFPPLDAGCSSLESLAEILLLQAPAEA